MKLMKMPKKNSDVAQRAWNLLRLALLWTRKGGLFKRSRLMMELRLVPKFLKGIGHSTAPPPRHDQICHYKERELSFDKSTILHVKMHRLASMRFLLPCISPDEVDFDYDFRIDEYDRVLYRYDSGRKSYSTGSEEEEEEEGEGGNEECGYEVCDDQKIPYLSEEEEGIDSKAEKFIEKFYEQIKLQRQNSYT